MTREEFVEKYHLSAVTVPLNLEVQYSVCSKEFYNKEHIEKEIKSICNDTNLKVFDIVTRIDYTLTRNCVLLIAKQDYNQCSSDSSSNHESRFYEDFVEDFNKMKSDEVELKEKQDSNHIKEAERICNLQKISYDEITKDDYFNTSSLYIGGFIQGYRSNTFSFWWKPSGERLLIIFNLGTFIIK